MKSKRLIITIIIYLSNYFFFLGQEDYNNFKTDSLIKLYYKSVGIENDTTLYSITSNIYDFSSDINIRLKYAQLSFELADKLNNYKYKGHAKLRLGITYKKLGDLRQATNEIHEALVFYENSDFEDGKLLAYSKLVPILAAQEEYEQAIVYLNKTLVRYKERADSIRYATTSLNIGELYRLSKKYIDAFNYSKEALNIFKEKNYQTGIGYALGNIGLIHLEQNNLVKAIIKLKQSIAILEPLGDNYSTSVYYEGLARVYQKQNKYKLALFPAQKSLSLAEADGLIEQIRDANLRLSEIYRDTKQYKQAYEYYLQYIVFRDSLVNEKNIREIANMRRQYEVAQKQAEVDELNRQQENLFTLQIFQAAVVVLLVVIVFVLAKYYRRKKAANKKLELQQTELKRLNATKDKFFSIISHDLRSPVATFQSFMELIGEMLTNNNIENLRRLFHDIKQSTQYILDLMDNLLSWGLSQKGEIPFSPGSCNVKQNIDDVCVVLGKTAFLKDIKLSFNVDKSLQVFADSRMLQSILRNLTTNAIKFTPNGGAVSISARASNGFVIVSIEDTGVGISEEKVKHLFDLDANKSTYGTQNEKGMGLGLRLVAEFVEKNNGKIHVESSVGKGTKVHVTLPVSEQQKSAPVAELLLELPISK